MKNLHIQSYIDAAISHTMTHRRNFKGSYFLEQNKKTETIFHNGKEYDFLKKKFIDEKKKYIIIFIGNKINKCLKAEIKYNDLTKKKIIMLMLKYLVIMKLVKKIRMTEL